MLNSEKTANPAVLIAVPVYNHAQSLGKVLQELKNLSLPLLVVDDGSQDQIEHVLTLHPDVKVLRHPVNRGKGAALTTAMRYAAAQGFSAILSFDADGQHLANDVPRLLAAYQAQPGAIIIGARDFVSQASGDIPGSSRFGRSFSNFWIWAESGVWLPDTQSGLRIYPSKLEVLENMRGQRYAFEIEILTRSIWQGIKVVSVPVQVYYPPRLERISHFQPFADNLRLSRTHSFLCILRILQLLGWQNGKSKELAGASFSARVIRLCGARFAYGLMIFPVLSSFIFRRRERNHLLHYYARIRPEWSEKKRLLGAFRNFWYFAASIVDRLSPESESLMPAAVEGHSLVEGRFPPPSSILIGAHYGDWFLIAKHASSLREQILGLVIDPSTTPAFFAALEKNMGDKLRILSIKQDMLSFALTVKDILDQGGRVCFLVDRVPDSEKTSGLDADFFAGKARIVRAPFAIAARLKVPVHFICALKEGYSSRAPYRVFAEEIWNGEGEISEGTLARRSMQALERRVQHAPQHWFNFVAFWQ